MRTVFVLKKVFISWLFFGIKKIYWLEKVQKNKWVE
jgi:hypothetical protein